MGELQEDCVSGFEALRQAVVEANVSKAMLCPLLCVHILTDVAPSQKIHSSSAPAGPLQPPYHPSLICAPSPSRPHLQMAPLQMVGTLGHLSFCRSALLVTMLWACFSQLAEC